LALECEGANLDGTTSVAGKRAIFSALRIVAKHRTTMVLHSLHFNRGTCRTGALVRSLPGCSKKMLTQTLREMERGRLIVDSVV